jgi:hypothetical protein
MGTFSDTVTFEILFYVILIAFIFLLLYAFGEKNWRLNFSIIAISGVLQILVGVLFNGDSAMVNWLQTIIVKLTIGIFIFLIFLSLLINSFEYLGERFPKLKRFITS